MTTILFAHRVGLKLDDVHLNLLTEVGKGYVLVTDTAGEHMLLYREGAIVAKFNLKDQHVRLASTTRVP